MQPAVDRPRHWIANWPLWSLRRRALAYALTVEILAAVAVAVTASHQSISRQDWIRLAILAGCVIAQTELTRRMDLVRHISSGKGPFLHNDTVWCVAAVVALPATLADAVVVIGMTWSWLRVWRRRRPLYRMAFSAMAVVLATEAAAGILAFDPGVYPGVPVGPAALGLAVVAGAVRWLVNFCLVSAVIVLSTPNHRARDLLVDIGERVLEIGAFGLGIASAALLTFEPILLAGIVVGVSTMHRGLLVPQFRHAARTDVKTNLNNAGWWQEMAAEAFRRAQPAGAGLGVLMLDLDHFKRVNDTYGHVAGDDVLHAVAAAITGEIRPDDTAGRWGGEEFAVLVPGVNTTELVAIAERIRRRVQTLVIQPDRATTIRDLTISIGAACHPDAAAASVGDLVVAADAALYEAKTNGRNQVRLAVAEPAARSDRHR